MDRKNISFDPMSVNWTNKRHLSDTAHTLWLIVAAVLAAACCYTSISFMRDLGTTPEARDTLTLFAIAIDAALFFLAIFCLPKGLGRPIQVLAILCAFLVSMFSIGSYFVSQQWANDNQSSVQNGKYLSYLTSSAPDTKASLASHAAYRDRVEKAIAVQSKVTSTPQTAIYAYVAKLLGTSKETIVLTFRLFCAFTLLLAAFAVKSFRQSFFTTKEISTHIQNFEKLKALNFDQVGLNSPTPSPLIHKVSTPQQGTPSKKFPVEHPVV